MLTETRSFEPFNLNNWIKPDVDGSKPLGNDEPSTTSDVTLENAILLCLLFSLVSREPTFVFNELSADAALEASDETAAERATSSVETLVVREVSAEVLVDVSVETLVLIEVTCERT